jgi:hypothetical protein
MELLRHTFGGMSVESARRVTKLILKLDAIVSQKLRRGEQSNPEIQHCIGNTHIN